MSWGTVAKISLASVGIIDAGSAINVFASKFKEMLEDYNKAFADPEIAEIIAAINRGKLILEQHADIYTGKEEVKTESPEFF